MRIRHVFSLNYFLELYIYVNEVSASHRLEYFFKVAILTKGSRDSLDLPKERVYS